MHKDLRYQLNSNAPSEEQKVKDINMIKLPWWKSIFHNPFKNNKYVSADGHLEGVYDKSSGYSDEKKLKRWQHLISLTQISKRLATRRQM